MTLTTSDAEVSNGLNQYFGPTHLLLDMGNLPVMLTYLSHVYITEIICTER